MTCRKGKVGYFPLDNSRTGDDRSDGHSGLIMYSFPLAVILLLLTGRKKQVASFKLPVFDWRKDVVERGVVSAGRNRRGREGTILGRKVKYFVIHVHV